MKLSLRTSILGLAGAALIVATSATAVAALSPAASPSSTASPAARAGKACAAEVIAAHANPSVATVRAVGDCEIARRLTTLDTLSAAISKAKALTSSDAATLNAEIAATRTGLTNLKAKIDAETSLEALKADVKAVATDYRVYLLVAPKVHLVIAADRVIAAEPLFANISGRLETAIARAKAAGKDVTAAQAALDAMNAKVAQAEALARPLPATLLPLTVAQYNGGTGRTVVADARSAMVKARDLLRDARLDAVAARDALKALR